MELLILIIPFFIALHLSQKMIPFIYLISYKKRLFDTIDKRKVHQDIVPRLGGVAFVPIQACMLTVIIVIFHKYNFLNDLHLDTGAILPMFLLLVTGLVMLFIVGLADDMIGIPYRSKFLIQIMVASFFPLSGLWINDFYGLFFITEISPWVGMPLTVFVVILIINAINLIDGLDGLCSGVVMVGCLVLGVLFAYNGAWLHAIFAFITTGILVPFFYFNVFGASKRRRRIFMGDTGSLTLGLSISFLAISYAMNNPDIKPFSEGAIVIAFTTLIIPVLDVARVMWVRYRNGKPVFMPDRNHIHHLFLNLGFTHRQSMILIISLAVFFSVFNIVGVNLISNNIVLLLDIVLWGGFHYALHKTVEKRNREKNRVKVFDELSTEKKKSKTDYDISPHVIKKLKTSNP